MANQAYPQCPTCGQRLPVKIRKGHRLGHNEDQRRIRIVRDARGYKVRVPLDKSR